jgi:hypothetical protein
MLRAGSDRVRRLLGRHLQTLQSIPPLQRLGALTTGVALTTYVSTSAFTSHNVASAEQALPVAATINKRRALSIDMIFDPEKSVDFTGKPPQILKWLNDSLSFVQLYADGRLDRINVVTGVAQPLFKRDMIQAALAALPHMDADAAHALVRKQSRFQFSPDESAVLIAAPDNLYYYHFRSQTVRHRDVSLLSVSL